MKTEFYEKHLFRAKSMLPENAEIMKIIPDTDDPEYRIIVEFKHVDIECFKRIRLLNGE